MKKLLLSFIIALVAVSSAFAQSTITGKILDEATNQGVPFVNVGLFRVSDTAFVSGAASDAEGVFKLQAVPKGEMTLKISAIGYESFEMPVTVNGDVNVGALKLKAGTTRLDEVVIAEKRPLFAVEGEKTMYNVAEDPSIQTGTLSDALQNAPGVSVDVEGNITLRGTSSVEVWINDKPSHMTAENLKTYIQTIPANSLDHVEVITNPSARYGSKADGIINIVTNAKVKRNEFYSFGVNASTTPMITPWFSYVWSNEKLTVNAYVNGGYSIWKGNMFSDQKLIDESENLLSHEIDTARYSSRNYSTGGYFSLGYEIDTANSLNVWISGWPNWGGNTNNSSIFREEFLPHPVTTAIDETVGAYNRNYFANGGLYYMHRFDNKGHNLSVSINGMGWGGANGGDVKREFTSPNDYTLMLTQENSYFHTGVEGEIVYNRPYSENGEISMGINSSYTPEKQYLRTDTIVDGEPVNDVYRSYRANFSDLSNDVFFTVQHKFGGLTVKPGIRFCSEYVKGVYPDSTQYNFSKPFFSFRPSLHLSYRTESMHNFNLSYTRRIAAPDAEELSAFPLYHVDSYRTGNPDLERVYTHTIEAGWTKYWNDFGSIGLSAYYRAKTNEVNEIQMSQYHWLYGRVVPYSYPVNVGKSSRLGFEYNMMYRPSGFFNLRFDADLYNLKIATVFDGQDYKPNAWAYSFDLSLWAKLWNKIEVTASADYSSPRPSLFSEWHSRFSVDAGLKADFFDRRMSVFVNANDIFNTSGWGETNFSPYVQSSSDAKYNSRSISVGLTFRFGKMELEQMARQGGGSPQNGPQGMGM